MTWLATAVGLGSSVIVLPVALHALSQAELALWLAFSLLLNLGMMADFGFAPAAVRSAAYFLAGMECLPTYGHRFEQPERSRECNFEGLRSLEGLLQWIYFRLSWLAILLTALSALWVAPARFSALKTPAEGWWALTALLLAMGITLQATLWSAMRQMIGGIAAVRFTESKIGILRLGMLITVLLAGGGVTGTFMIQAVMALITWRSHRVAYAKERLQIGLSGALPKAYCEPKLFKAIWPATWRQGIITIGGFFINQSGGLIVAHASNSGQAAQYLLTLRLFGIARQFALAPIYAHLPYFNRLLAEGEVSKIKREFARRMVLSMTVISAAILGIYIAFDMIAPLLGYRRFLLGGCAYAIMGIALLLESHHGAHSQIYLARNHVPFLIPSIASGVITFGLGYWIVGIYGVVGVVAVQACVQLACNNWYPVYLNLRGLNWSFSEYIVDLFKSALPSSLNWKNA
jgi:hypothetical protein